VTSQAITTTDANGTDSTSSAIGGGADVGQRLAARRHLVDGRIYQVRHLRLSGGYELLRVRRRASRTSSRVAFWTPDRGLRIDDTGDDVAAILADPDGTATAYTRATGHCACCGAPTSDPDHVCACKRCRAQAVAS